MSFWRHDYFWPVVLIVVGFTSCCVTQAGLDWLSGDIVWPVLLIGLRVWLIGPPSRAT